MVRSRLVPEVRPDINGKMVTRHVLPDRSSGAQLNVPPPAVDAPAERNMSAAIYAYRISRFIQSDGDAMRAAVIAEVLEEGLHKETLIALHDRMTGFSEPEIGFLRDHSVSLFNDLVLRGADSESREKIFWGLMESIDTIGVFYGFLNHRNFLECSDDAIRQAERIGVDPRSTHWFERDTYRFLLIKNLLGDRFAIDPMDASEGAVWFSENRERVLASVPMLLAREVTDWKLARDITAPDTPSGLSGGIL